MNDVTAVAGCGGARFCFASVGGMGSRSCGGGGLRARGVASSASSRGFRRSLRRVASGRGLDPDDSRPMLALTFLFSFSLFSLFHCFSLLLFSREPRLRCHQKLSKVFFFWKSKSNSCTSKSFMTKNLLEMYDDFSTRSSLRKLKKVEKDEWKPEAAMQ